MYYLVTIGYESDQLDRNGNPRIQKVKYVFEGNSAEEVIYLVSKYTKSDVRGSELLSVVKTPIECVIDSKNNPEYYK